MARTKLRARFFSVTPLNVAARHQGFSIPGNPLSCQKFTSHHSGLYAGCCLNSTKVRERVQSDDPQEGTKEVTFRRCFRARRSVRPDRGLWGCERVSAQQSAHRQVKQIGPHEPVRQHHARLSCVRNAPDFFCFLWHAT